MPTIKNLSVFNIDYYEESAKPYSRDFYYRFMLSSYEKERLKENKIYLKNHHDLKLSDVVRYFALNYSTNQMILSDMRLIYDDERFIKYRLSVRH